MRAAGNSSTSRCRNSNASLTTERLERAIALLDRFHPKEQYPELWQALNAELDRRKLAASAHPIVIARRHLLDLPFAVKEALQLP